MSRYIAIDLDGQGLYITAGTARGGQVKVDQAIAWAGTEAEGGPPALTPENARAIGEQLRERLKAAGISPAPVIVSVPRDRVVLKELRYPEVPPAEEPNVVRFQAMKELSDSPDEVRLDYVPVSGAAAGERRSMAVAIRKSLYKAIEQMCAGATLRLVAVTPRPFAISAGLINAFAAGTTTTPTSKSDAVAVLTLGPGGGEFNVTRDGEITFTRTVPAPVMQSDGMLLAEVRRNLTMYAGANPGNPIQAMYVAESSGRWALRLGSALGIPVHAYDPLAGAAPSVDDPARGRFAGSAGLLAVRAGKELPINFVTPRQPREVADPNRQLALVGVLVVVLVGAVGLLGGWMLLEGANRVVAMKTRERDDAKKKWEQEASPEQQRLEAAKTWEERHIDVLNELFDAAHRFEVQPGVHITSFTAKVIPPDTKTGKQENQAQITLKVTAKTPEPGEPDPIEKLVDTLRADAVNPAATNPKSKNPPKPFYDDINFKIGSASKEVPGAREYTITYDVNLRDPELYTRNPEAMPELKRDLYPPKPGATGKRPRK